MEFFVYNNIHDLDNRIPRHDLSRIKIKNIYIFKKNNTFWFETDYEYQETHVNLNKAFLHIHKGITSMNNMKFDEKPYTVNKIKYNPKSKNIEIRDSWLPWKKPFWWKNCEKIGIMPKKALDIEEMYYDHSKKHIYFILNYFPQAVKYELKDEPVSEEQLKHIEELEKQLK